MLKIRLQRVGRKNDPSFRLVVTEHTNKPQTGNVLEVLGSYDARKGDPVLKTDRITHWLEKGAQTSDTVHNLLVRGGVIEGKTVNPLPKKSPIKKEEDEKQEAPASDTPAEQPETETTEQQPAEQQPEPKKEDEPQEDSSEEKPEKETKEEEKE